MKRINHHFGVVIGLIFLCLFFYSQTPAKDIDIAQFGAKGDGVTLNTGAIQQSIDACAQSGGGRVTVPAGVFLSGTIFLKSRVDLFLQAGAVLKGSDQIDAYQAADHTPALILAVDLHEVSVTGLGTLDGNGQAKPFQKGNDAEGRPMLLFFIRCKDVTVKNIRLRSPAFWTEKYEGCDGVLVTGISVYAHANWNNDGIDIDSRNVLVSNCRFDTDDDAICLKSERTDPCENVTITNCVAASNCNGIKLGTASSGGFQNINISQVVIHHASEDKIRHWQKSLPGIMEDKTVLSGIAIECVDGGSTNGIDINHITMRDVQTPLFLRLGARHSPPGSLQHVDISDIIATSVSTMCSIISGIPGFDIKDVSIHDVELVNRAAGSFTNHVGKVPENIKGYPENRMFGTELPAAAFFIRHAENIRLAHISLETDSAEKRPFLVADRVQYLVADDAGFAAGARIHPSVIYGLSEVRHAVMTMPAFLPSFQKLLYVEGSNCEDIRLLMTASRKQTGLISWGPGIRRRDIVKVMDLSAR